MFCALDLGLGEQTAKQKSHLVLMFIYLKAFPDVDVDVAISQIISNFISDYVRRQPTN